MGITISNEILTATFASKGAELQKLVNLENNISYLWSGDDDVWGKFSPVLFPIVGALKDSTYLYEGKSYQLPRHGFARDMVFDANKISETEILFTLKANSDTLKIYPFEFKLTVRYRLNGSTLSCTYEVSNIASGPMYFSIGGHPAFAVPINNVGGYSDYYLQFNKDTELKCHKIEDGLISNRTQHIALVDGKLSLSKQLFDNDALVIKDLQSDTISLRGAQNNNGLTFSFKDFPFFGIWAAKGGDFVCLEPWCGIADAVNHNQQLTEKEGIVELSESNNWQRTWEVTCF